MPTEAGSVFTRLSAVFEERNYDRFDSRNAKARADAAKPINAKLGAEVDHASMSKAEADFNRRVDDIESKHATITLDVDLSEARRDLRDAEAEFRKYAKARKEVGDEDARGAANRLRYASNQLAKQRELVRALEDEGRAVRRLTSDQDRRNATVQATAKQQADLRRETQGLTREMRALGGAGGGADRNMGRLARAFAGSSGAADRLGRSIHRIIPGLSLSTRLPVYRIVAIGTAFAGIIPPVLALAGALGPLVGLLGALPGLAAAGIGAFAATSLGLRGVGDAVSEAWNVQTEAAAGTAAATDQAGAAMERTREAARSLAEAERGVADAQEGVVDAQEDLNEAREQAVENIKEMREELRGQALDEAGATLSVREAQEQLAEAEESGTATALELAQARLALKEAEQGLDDTRRDGARKAKELADAERAGVNRAPEVIAAREGLADAEEGVADAQRSVKEAARELRQAQQGATEATQAASGATDQLKEKMAELSPAGRAYVRFIERELFPAVRNLRSIAQQGLLPGLQAGIEASMQNMPVVARAIRDYSTALGEAAKSQGELLGEQGVGRDLGVILAEGRDRMTEATKAAFNWERVLIDVAIAARPLSDWLGKMNVQLSESARKWAESGRESGNLEEFFRRTIRVTKLVVETIADVAVGLRNMSEIGRKAFGDDLLRSINDAAEAFRRWTESIEGRAEIRRYFEFWQRTWNDIIDIIRSAIQEFKDLKKEGASTIEALSVLAAEAMARIIPIVLQQVGQAIPHLVKGFVEGWLASDMWGKLLLPGWLLFKFGGLGAAVRMGGRLATALVTGFLGAGALKKIGLGSLLAGGTAAAASGPGALVRGAAPAAAPAAGGIGGAVAGVGARIVGGVAGGAALTALLEGVPAVPGLKQGGRTPSIVELIFGKGGEKEVEKAKRGIADVRQRLRGLIKQRQEMFEQGISTKDWDEAIARVTRRLDGLLGHRALKGRGLKLRAEDLIADDVPKALANLERSFKALETSVPSSLRELHGNMRIQTNAISQTFEKGSQGWRDAMSKNSEAGIKALSNAMRDGEISTKRGTEEILRLSRKNYGEAKDVTQRRMREAQEAIQNAMRRGEIATREGLGMIRSLFRKELKAYGFTEKQAFNVSRGQSYIGGPEEGWADVGREAGGWAPEPFAFGGRVSGRFLGGQGERGRDLVHAILGRGEAVLNNPQQKVVNQALGRVGIRGLPDLFQRTKGTKHSRMEEGGIAELPAFAPGGYVGGAQKPRGAAMSAYANKLFKLGFSVTSGGEYRGTGTYHDQQMATDWGDSVNDLQKLWSIVYRDRAGMAELLGPTFVSPNGGLYNFGTKFDDPGLQAQHQDHIHIAITSAIKGVLGRIAKIASLRVGGPNSAIRGIVQRGLDGVRKGAQRRLNRAVRAVEGAEGSFQMTAGNYEGPLNRLFPAHSLAEAPGQAQLSMSQVVGLARDAGFGHGTRRSPEEQAVIAERESTLYPGVVSWDGGYGLWQHTPGAGGWGTGPAFQALQKLGGIGQMLNPWKNAVMAYQLDKMSVGDPWSASAAGGGFAGLPFAGSFEGGGMTTKEVVSGATTEAGTVVGAGSFPTASKRLGGWFRQVTKIRQNIDDENTRYSNQVRRFDLTEEEFVDEGEVDDDGNIIRQPSINMDQVKQRMTELYKLQEIQNNILEMRDRLIRYITRIRNQYQRMIVRLQEVRKNLNRSLARLKGRKGKQAEKGRERIGAFIEQINDRIGATRGNIKAQNQELEQEQYDRESTAIDVEEIRKELTPLFLTTLGLPGGIEKPDDFEPPEGAESADARGQADKEKARADVLAKDVQLLSGAFRAFASPSDIGTATGATALAGVTNPYGTAGYTGPGSQPATYPTLSAEGQQAAGPYYPPQVADGFVQNIYALHPGDPAILKAIGETTVQSFSNQSYVPSNRTGVSM